MADHSTETGPDDTGSGDFHHLMGRLPTAMVVVTTASAGERSGCLVGFHAQCGIDPPRYGIWLSKANHTYRVGALCDRFVVHALRPEHHELAELFGGLSGDDVDKFERCAWHAGPDGVPILDDVPDRFVARKIAWLDAGADHVCVILAPEAVDEGPDGAGWLTIEQVTDIEAGHAAEERQRPDD